MELWTVKGLSYVASALGKPLYMDKVTEDISRIGFARVCIEFDSAVGFLDDFDLIMPNRETLVVEVEYQWKPKFCNYCSKFGHLNSFCLSNPDRKNVENENGDPIKEKNTNPTMDSQACTRVVKAKGLAKKGQSSNSNGHERSYDDVKRGENEKVKA